MMFNATFNNISVISWWSVLLDKTNDLSQVIDKLNHKMWYISPWSRFELTTLVMIGTDCIGSCKYNYHTITAMTSPFSIVFVCVYTSNEQNEGLDKIFRNVFWSRQIEITTSISLFDPIYLSNMFFHIYNMHCKLNYCIQKMYL